MAIVPSLEVHLGGRADQPPRRRVVRDQPARGRAQRQDFPKPAKAYLDDWAAPEAGWLRKYYPDSSDEPHFDATPAVEKALQWVDGLREREFVGTESRLNVIFELLRQIVLG